MHERGFSRTMGGLCVCRGTAGVSFVYITQIHTVYVLSVTPAPASNVSSGVNLPSVLTQTQADLFIYCVCVYLACSAFRNKKVLECARRTGLAHESVLEALTLIRKMGLYCAWCCIV